MMAKQDRARRFVDTDALLWSVRDADGDLIDPRTRKKLTPKENEQRLQREADALRKQVEREAT